MRRALVMLGLAACGGTSERPPPPHAAPIENHAAEPPAPTPAQSSSTTFRSADTCREYAAEVDRYASCAKAPPAEVSDARAKLAALAADPQATADDCDARLSLLRLTEEQEGCD